MFRARNGSPPGRGGIAWDHEVVGDGATLDFILRAPWAVGINFAFLVSIFLRIAVDQHGGGAFALRGERFESTIAIGVGIAHQNYFSFDADAVLAQHFVVFGIAAVGVDHWRGHVTGDRHAEPCAADGGVFRVVVAGERGFAQRRLIVHGRRHLQKGTFGIGAVDVVLADDDVFEPLLLPFIAHVFGEFVVALRTSDVGFLGENAVLAAFFVGRREGFVFFFYCGFVGGMGGGEAQDLRVGGAGQHEE